LRLTKVQITEFQCIRDSNEFEVGDITCLVGKNEAGKTALLQALRRLNPIEGDESYSVTDDYPRWDVEDYRQEVESGRKEDATVVRAIYELEPSDIEVVEEVFGPNAIKEPVLTLSKGYGKKCTFAISIDEVAALRYLVSQNDLSSDLVGKLQEVKTVREILQILGEAEQTEAVKKLVQTLNPMQEKGVGYYIYNSLLYPREPKFLYFDEYYQMHGCANIEQLKKRIEQDALQEPDYPLLGLIKLARLDLDQLLNPQRTLELKNRLEGAGNYLTRKIINYWSQNKHLQMRFDVRPGQPQDPDGMREGTNIWAEAYDTKRWVSTGLSKRSRGFVWFFSFLAWYSDLKKKDTPMILLLDEPGLFLHAKAQEDLLNYFEAEIKGTHQLIYTTHSPFMIDPTHFERVRIVEDKSIDVDQELSRDEEGTKVITEVLEVSQDSLFPLQGALGYELYQTLFVGPNSLAVEGVSDLLYLQTMSTVIERSGGSGLDPGWTITPVGGSDKVPTFVALLGSQSDLNIATLIDYQKKDHQNIENLYKRKLLKKNNVLTYADFTGTAEADVEDMFDLNLYLHLVNQEYQESLQKPVADCDLDANLPRIIKRLERFFESNPMKDGVQFNHYRPARFFAENVTLLLEDISKETLERFSQAFERLNALLKK
jgi:predicted ATP-dependent endonuclease of OLD family